MDNIGNQLNGSSGAGGIGDNDYSNDDFHFSDIEGSAVKRYGLFSFCF